MQAQLHKTEHLGRVRVHVDLLGLLPRVFKSFLSAFKKTLKRLTVQVTVLSDFGGTLKREFTR